jgi:hypothetical protein
LSDIGSPQATGGHHRGEPLDEATSPVAPGPEADLAPDHHWPQGPLGCVVGRLDPLDLDKGPERRPDLEQVSTDLVGGRSGQTTFQELAHLILDRRQVCFELGPIALARLDEGMPGDEDPRLAIEKRLAQRTCLTAPSGEPSEVADQVRVADGSLLERDSIIALEAVGPDDPSEVRAVRSHRAATSPTLIGTEHQLLTKETISR